MVLMIPKWYHMWGYSDKIPIKTLKIHQITTWRTFLIFLIFLTVIKRYKYTFWVLPWSLWFQNGNICGVTLTKSPSRHSKSSKSPLKGHSWPSWSSWWWSKGINILSEYYHDHKDSKKVWRLYVCVKKGVFAAFHPGWGIVRRSQAVIVRSQENRSRRRRRRRSWCWESSSVTNVATR